MEHERKKTSMCRGVCIRSKQCQIIYTSGQSHVHKWIPYVYDLIYMNGFIIHITIWQRKWEIVKKEKTAHWQAYCRRAKYIKGNVNHLPVYFFLSRSHQIGSWLCACSIYYAFILLFLIKCHWILNASENKCATQIQFRNGKKLPHTNFIERWDRRKVCRMIWSICSKENSVSTSIVYVCQSVVLVVYPLHSWMVEFYGREWK